MLDSSLQSQVNALRERVEEIEEATRQLTAAIAPPIRWASWLPPLTRREEQLLGLLARREFLSLTSLEVLWTGDCDPKLVDQYVLKLRRKLAAGGVEIRNRFGQGYYITKEHRHILLPESNDLIASYESEKTRPKKTEANSDDRVRPMAVRQIEIIEDALEVFRGNVSEAARALEINPSTIYRHLGRNEKAVD